MTNHKTALITGIHGQDGYYLSRLLLEKGYRVTGVGRGARGPNWPHASDIDYLSGDLHDLAQLIWLFKELRPSQVYNLAAQSFVPLSWEQPAGHCHVNRVGPQRPALDSLSGGRTGTFPYIECVFSKSFECESIA